METYNTSFILVVSFIVAMIYDFVLRQISLRNITEWVVSTSLRPYYTELSLMTVMLHAGFIVSVTQYLVSVVMKLIYKSTNFANYFRLKLTKFHKTIVFLIVSFVVGALMGFPIRLSGLFKELTGTYYRGIGTAQRGMLSDGISMLIINVTVIVVMLFLDDENDTGALERVPPS